MKKKLIPILVVIVVFLGGVVAATYLTEGVPPITLGSIETGQEYTATTTPTVGDQVDRLIREGWGTLGSVIVTGAGDSEVWLLNATTSLALSDYATSTVLLGVLPASLAAGTYQFDVEYTTGLYLDVMAGSTGTTTITFR